MSQTQENLTALLGTQVEIQVQTPFHVRATGNLCLSAYGEFVVEIAGCREVGMNEIRFHPDKVKATWEKRGGTVILL